jgi:hypothetical protein
MVRAMRVARNTFSVAQHDAGLNVRVNMDKPQVFELPEYCSTHWLGQWYKGNHTTYAVFTAPASHKQDIILHLKQLGFTPEFLDIA